MAGVVLKVKVVEPCPTARVAEPHVGDPQVADLERNYGQDVSSITILFDAFCLRRNLFSPSAMGRDAHTVAGWDFDRVIPCHGVCFYSSLRFYALADISSRRM